MKPKEALVKDGFLPPDASGRGRLSKDADARCKELAAQGWQIDGYSVAKSADTSKPDTVVKVKTDPNSVSEIPNPTRDEKALVAYSGNIKIGMRTVCNNCRRSLTYCPCESPRVWLDHNNQGIVYFKVKA